MKYAGETIRITCQSTDFGGAAMDDSDVLGVYVSIYDSTDAEVVAEDEMTWDETEGLWYWVWDTTDVAAGTYQARCRLEGLDSLSSWEWQNIRLISNPA